jgi:hypothetical protein
VETTLPAVPPLCLSLHVCDGVVHHAEMGKVTIVGAFRNLESSRFPKVLPPFLVWSELTGGHGPTVLAVNVFQVSPHEAEPVPLFEETRLVRFNDPRLVIELDVPVNDLVLDQSGEYRIRLECDGQTIAERRFFAILPT